LDNELYKIALKCGVNCKTGTEVEDIHFEENQFKIQLSHSNQIIYAKYVLGAYGKRAKLDQYLQRPFFKLEAPMLELNIIYDTTIQKT
jgi:uncharacterized FAD-dependent dehydrogenase